MPDDSTDSRNLSPQYRPPSWLESPPTSAPDPPIETCQQTLRLDELTWENFERLCLRLARLEADVEDCRLYGVRGQVQEGIDLYARLKGDGKYRVYQCKKVRRFGPAAIRGAVTNFLASKWRREASSLVLRTTHDATRTQYADEVEAQRKRLAGDGITLIPWDIEEISRRLKQQAELVDDFFGRPWTVAFCGKEAAEALGHRLDATEVIAFRRDLGKFYRLVFNKHDPSIPVAPRPGVADIPLSARYVLPDILSEQSAAFVPDSGSPPGPVQSRDDYAKVAPGTFTESVMPPLGQRSAPARTTQRSYQLRERIDTWLAKSDRSVVVGGPGGGKSSLLRFLALDLLSESAALDNLSAQWARLLPVWIPFGYWTRLINSAIGSQCSISECLRQWLGEWNESQLWPLVDGAIKDKRLLLLVDGLDEWVNEESGRNACQMLQVFVEARDLAIVITGQPYGLQRIPIHGSGWQVGTLAGLSPEQRQELCSKWFKIKINQDADDRGDPTHVTSNLIQRETDLFIVELRESHDLEEISRVPLLLLLLVYLKFQQATLPRQRFEAYDLLVEHLLRKHPAGRRAAAGLGKAAEGLSDADIRRVLACVAFHVQVCHPDGMVREDEVESVAKEFLTDPDLGLGLSPGEAHSYATQFTHVAEEELGLLVREGVRELEFFHRTLREFLAAVHLSRMPLQEQESLIKAHSTDPGWREVILGVFWLTSPPDNLSRLLAQVREMVNEIPGGLFARELIAEVAFGEFDCPASVAQRDALETFEVIERHPWIPHRKRLLRQALDGLRSKKTGKLARGRVRRWVYSRGSWRPSWYDAMSGWPLTAETSTLLLTALHDEDGNVQRAVAHALATVGRGDERTGDAVAEVAMRFLDPSVRAAALECLTLGWPDHPRISLALSEARNSRSPELRLAAIAARVRRGIRDDSDFQEILKMARRDFWSGVPYAWSSELTSALVLGWRGFESLKNECLEGARQGFTHGHHVTKQFAEAVLLAAFPHDEEVAKYCAMEIRGEHPFGGLSAGSPWELLSRNFRDNPPIAEAIDEWSSKQMAFGPYLAQAALVGRTPTIKRKLLAGLLSSAPHWEAWSLMEGWGMEDGESAAALTKVALGPAGPASWIAHLIPRILPDAAKARARLLDLVGDSECRRCAFVASGLASLSPRGDEDQIVERCLDALPSVAEWEREDFKSEIIVGLPRSNRIRELALKSLEEREPPIAAVASAFSGDDEIRSRVAQLVNPLPSSLRAQIVMELTDTIADRDFAISVLKDYDVESDDEVKVLSSIGYHRLLHQEKKDNTDAVQKLSEGISAYGIDFEKRRRAAFAGLVVLQRLDLFAGAKEGLGEPRVLAINLGEMGEANLPIIRLIAEHWTEARTALGPNLRLQLTGHLSSLGLWEALCLVAADYPATHADVLSALDADPEIAVHPNALRFLAAIRPRSQLLQDRCLSSLKSKKPLGINEWAPASTIFAEAFGGDPAALAALVAGRPSDLSAFGFSTIAALSAGWPDSTILDELFSHLQSHPRPPISEAAFYALLYARIPASQIIDTLRNHLASANIYNYLLLSSPLLLRLRNDAEARDHLSNLLTSDLDPNLKATIPRALAASAGVSKELAEWCRAELHHQQEELGSPQLGLDLFAGSVRGVTLSLLDVLGTSW